MTKRLQTAAFGPTTVTQNSPTLIGSYTADADREIKINSLILPATGVSVVKVFASVTRSGYAESAVYDYDHNYSGM
jgi:hypothetical protein